MYQKRVKEINQRQLSNFTALIVILSIVFYACESNFSNKHSIKLDANEWNLNTRQYYENKCYNPDFNKLIIFSFEKVRPQICKLLSTSLIKLNNVERIIEFGQLNINFIKVRIFTKDGNYYSFMYNPDYESLMFLNSGKHKGFGLKNECSFSEALYHTKISIKSRVIDSKIVIEQLKYY